MCSKCALFFLSAIWAKKKKEKERHVAPSVSCEKMRNEKMRRSEKKNLLFERRDREKYTPSGELCSGRVTMHEETHFGLLAFAPSALPGAGDVNSYHVALILHTTLGFQI